MAIKKINYNGSSKVIIRLCEVVNDLIDGGSGGHTIQNSAGTDMTARTNLQFTGASVSDDAVNDRTVVDVPTYSDATQSASGLMSASDKTKLDGIASGAEVNVQSDWTEADNTSDAYIANKPNLATVATSGAYSDLSGTPDLTNVAYKHVNNRFSANQTVDLVNGTTTTDGQSILGLGNSTPSGTDGNSYGLLRLWGKGNKNTDLVAPDSTTSRTINFPDASGTVALVPSVYTTITKNAVSCPNGGVTTTIGSISLTKGVWVVELYGYSPILPSNNVIKAITQIIVASVGQQSLTYRFTLCGIVSLAQDTVLNVNVINWEDTAYTSGTNYNLKAIKIG